LAGTGFVVVGRRRDAATDNLAGGVPARAAVRQGVHHFGDAGGQLPQPVGEILRRHAVIAEMTDDKFSTTNFQ